MAQQQPPKAYVSFWRRQFALDPTPKQQVFDVFFGIVLPIVCLICDPIVFKGIFIFRYTHLFSILFYAFFAGQIAALIFYLFMRWNHPLLAGWLLCGAAAAFVLGVCMLPLSVMGLMLYLIGALGFTPFFTAFVYARNAIRILRNQSTLFAYPVFAWFIIGLLFSMTIPGVAGVYIMLNDSMSWIVVVCFDKDLRCSNRRSLAFERLYIFRWFVDVEQLERAYHEAEDVELKRDIASAYLKITKRIIPGWTPPPRIEHPTTTPIPPVVGTPFPLWTPPPYPTATPPAGP